MKSSAAKLLKSIPTAVRHDNMMARLASAVIAHDKAGIVFPGQKISRTAFAAIPKTQACNLEYFFHF